MLSLGAIFNKLGNTNSNTISNNVIKNNKQTNNNVNSSINTYKGKPNGNIGSITFNSRKKIDKTKIDITSTTNTNNNKTVLKKDINKSKLSLKSNSNPKLNSSSNSNSNANASKDMNDMEMSTDTNTNTTTNTNTRNTIDNTIPMDIDIHPTNPNLNPNPNPSDKRTRYNHNNDELDIHQHNAHPKDLDRERGALKRPKLIHELPSIVKNIFTEQSFQDLGLYLPSRMIDILQGYNYSSTDTASNTASNTDSNSITDNNDTGIVSNTTSTNTSTPTPTSKKIDINNSFNLPSSTKIQSVTIPTLLMDANQTLNYNNQKIPVSNKILIKSQTGSGKTLAYLIPIVTTLMKINDTNSNNITPFHGSINRTDGVRALILVPTRELCLQVSNSCNKLVEYCCKNCVVGELTR